MSIAHSANEGRTLYKLLSNLPFACSCIAYGGACTKASKKHLSALPRIMFKQDFKAEDLK